MDKLTFSEATFSAMPQFSGRVFSCLNATPAASCCLSLVHTLDNPPQIFAISPRTATKTVCTDEPNASSLSAVHPSFPVGDVLPSRYVPFAPEGQVSASLRISGARFPMYAMTNFNK